MTNKFICKEALGTLFGYGHIALKALAIHTHTHIHINTQNHTLPIHGLPGKVDPVSAKFAENLLPSLAYFFKIKIVPLVGARPTRYTRDSVSKPIA